MIGWAAARTFLTSRLGLGLIGALVLALAVWRVLAWHERKIEAVELAAGKARDTQWQVAFSAQRAASRAWKAALTVRQLQLAEERRKTHESNLRRSAAVADDLRLRGPGFAAAAADCRPGADPRSGPAAGGHRAAAAQPDAPGPRLPADDRPGEFAIVPWGWLVQRAEEHDALLSEATAWRGHDAEQRALLLDRREELRRKLEAAQPARKWP